MSSVCVVCTRARALITDRDRRHQHAVLCTLLLLRRLRTQHPSTPLAARRCLRSRLLHHRRCCLRSRLLLGPWPLLLLALGLAASQSPPSLLALAAPPSPPLARFSLSFHTCLWLFRRSAELLLRPYHCCRWRFFSFFSFFSFLSYFSFLGIAFSPHIYYTYFILFYYV